MDIEARNSPYFPNIYTKSKSNNYPVQSKSCKDILSIDYPFEQVGFLKNVYQYFNERGIKYIIVFMPINPDQCEVEIYEDQVIIYKELIESNTKIQVLDYTNSINKDYFYDMVHLNWNGGQVFSNILSQNLINLSE